MANRYLSQIEGVLWPEGFSRDMWMVVDGARDPRVYSLLLESYMDYSCLYAGDLPPALERSAPYLVQLDFESRYGRRLIEEAWGNSWGIFIKCDARMEVLRRHLRRFLRVRDFRGRFLLFRYYDPRVMRVYLPTCNSEELRTVFGPVDCYYLEDENPASIWEHRMVAGKLESRRLPLRAARAV